MSQAPGDTDALLSGRFPLLCLGSGETRPGIVPSFFCISLYKIHQSMPREGGTLEGRCGNERVNPGQGWRKRCSHVSLVPAALMGLGEDGAHIFQVLSPTSLMLSC
ncbi:hypothetical protein GDO81_025050 [Engystomops pustulosus]|uniref:Uncharacterized protein n=1 Tax=Engystomops pustulosus TaxID=76066 RepID=A0AAV6YN51_ENGPU|nr:hypothetical protein GDO81_025050 [Engystomops pustulosus]